MKNWENLFKSKRVTLMGLGLLGRGVGDAVFLAKAGAKLTVTDLKNKKELTPSLKALKKFKDIKFVLGEHRLEDFQKTDMVVKAAGVPLDSPFVLEAQKCGIPVAMSASLFAEYTEAEVVGITGTRGKSTVAFLLREILKERNKERNKKEHNKTNSKTNSNPSKNSASKVFLGGNVLGVSTLNLLSKTKAGDTAVLELDSWQLQGFGGTHNRQLPKKPEEFFGFSPSVAVFTTFMPDHMNYYNNDMKRYFDDKANIYRFQTADDVLIMSEQVADYIKRFGPEPKSKVAIARTTDIPDSWKIKIPGEHNRLNIALAFAAAKFLGVSEKTIRKVVESFKAIPGRLELVRKYKGVEIYNDTNATTPEATMAGLMAFGKNSGKNSHKDPNKNSDKNPKNNQGTILIFGGADKNLNPNELLKILSHYAKALVVLPGTGTDLIKEKITAEYFDRPSEKSGSSSKRLSVIFVKNMAEAVKSALGFAVSGDRILMSPAFASFGLFKNEYDRGDQFNKIVKGL